MPGSIHRRVLPLGVLALAVAGVGVTQVSGAIPYPGDGRFYACFQKGSGAVRVVNYPKVDGCPKGQKLIDWGRTGPQGPAGPQGPGGPQGPAGPADWDAIPNKPAGFADGVDNEGVTSVRLTQVIGIAKQVAANSTGFAEATCPAGSRVTGGGFFSSNVTAFNLSSSIPSLSTLGSWFVDGANTGGVSLGLTAYAVCMSVEPAGAFATAKKGLLPASVKKAMKKRGR